VTQLDSTTTRTMPKALVGKRQLELKSHIIDGEFTLKIRALVCNDALQLRVISFQVEWNLGLSLYKITSDILPVVKRCNIAPVLNLIKLETVHPQAQVRSTFTASVGRNNPTKIILQADNSDRRLPEVQQQQQVQVLTSTGFFPGLAITVDFNCIAHNPVRTNQSVHSRRSATLLQR
jgi:hypothetical protein